MTNSVNLRFSEKAMKIWNNLPLVLTLLIKRQNKWEMFSNLVTFSQCPNFNKNDMFAACRDFKEKNYGDCYISINEALSQKCHPYSIFG